MTILRSSLLCTAALFCAAPLTTACANAPVASAEGYALAQPGLARVYGGVRSVATDFRNNTSGALSPSGYNASSNISAGASFTDTITIGATGLAQGGFGKLPDGVFISGASGHDYSIDPTAAVVTTPVPEPETYALMLAGLLATGIALRRRRA